MEPSILFEGKIPTVLSLHPPDNCSTRPPPPIHLLLPRQTFLHLGARPAVSKLRESSVAGVVMQLGAFQTDEDTSSNSIPDEQIDSNVWFSHNGRPLRWQIPTGVLYDLVQPSALPWELTIHFTSFPETLLPFPSISTLRSFFNNSLKESIYVTSGGDALSTVVTKETMERLWRSVENKCDRRTEV